LTPVPDEGYYRNPELGFWFLYPAGWLKEETGGDLPAVVISDDDDPVRLLAGGRAVEEGVELADFAQGVGTELGLAEEVELVDDGPAALVDGTPAWEVAFAWEDESGEAFRAEGYVTLSGGKGYALVLVAHPEVLEARRRTLQAICGTLHLEEPELFGVSRTNALVLMRDAPVTLDPALTHEGPAGIVGHVFSGLVRLDADLQVEADLAADWAVSEDGTKYTFNLRSNVAFHSGRPLTAADVKAAWERAADPATGSPTAALYLGDIVGAAEKLAGEADELEGVRVLDDHTLVVTIDGPKPYFPAKLAQPVAFVVQADNVDDGADWWRHPDGTGPFVLDRWREGEVVILKRNEAYYLTPPQVSAVIYYLASGSGFPAYEAGQVDVAEVAPIFMARALDPADPLSADLVTGNTFCTYCVVFDTTREPFDDPAIRRAFALAVDREQLARVVLNDSAVPATGFLPPGMPGAVTRPVGHAFDVEAALNLVGGASLPELTLTAPGAGDPDPLVVALADMWAANLGVSIETELVNPSGYEDAIVRAHGHLFVHSRCADYADPENVLDLPYHSEGPLNYGGYADPQVDELLEAARTEADPGERLALYQEAEALLLEDAPAVPVVHPVAHVLVRLYVRGFRLSPIPVLWPAFVAIER
jgi:ABC-type transport system substrate-binding protein